MKTFVLRIFKLFYSQMDLSVYYSIKKLTLLFFLQKVIGINRRVPWPVHFTSQVISHENIEKQTAKNPGGAMNCYIDGRNGVVIGKNVWIGPGVSIISKNHSLENFDVYISGRPIIIGENSLLLTNCIILPEVELGEHTVVAAGSVVTKSFLEKNQLIGGNPARVLKKLEPFKKQ